MRDYKTVAQRVLQRRDAYVLAKKRKRQMMIKYAAIPACLFLVIGAGIRIWKQTDSGRHILKQNKVEMTDTTTTIAGNIENTDSTDSSMDSVLYETESQSGADNPTPIQTGETNTDPIPTDAAVSSADAESEHNAVVETRQTERVITEVIVLEVPIIQETEPEQNVISPTEEIPEPTSPGDNEPTTKPSIQPTEPPATIPKPTDPPDPTYSEPEPPATVPTATVPKPTDPPDPTYSEPEPPATVPTATVPDPTNDSSDAPPPVMPFTTTLPDSDVLQSTTAVSSHEPTTTTVPVKKPTNYTITIEEFTPTREQLSNVTHETVSMNFSENYDSFQQLFENAGAAVRCKVLSVAYTIMQDMPYTVYNIEITESICGSFIKGDKLSIVQYGGYLLSENTPPPPGDTPDNDPGSPGTQTSDLIEIQITGSETPVVSQEYVLFLTQDDVFDGAYEILHENEGMFRYDPKTGELIRSVEQDVAFNSNSYGDLLKAGEQFANIDS